MKRTQLKDALRNIRKQKVSYLSIIVIAFLGVSTFLGINYSDGALRKNGSIMYNAVNYRDLEIVSTSLLTEEDLAAIRDVEGVVDAEPVWQTGAKASAGDRRQDINVITLTERMNRPEIIEGRLPESAGECAVEQRLAADMGWQVGDAVCAQNAKGEAAQYLKNDTFEIVGIANHPDHTSISIPDTLYVMVRKEAFDVEALDDCFMKAEIVVEKPRDIDRFSAGYEAAVGEVSARLKTVAAERAPIRDEAVQDRVQSQLDDAQTQLHDASQQLQQAREELDDGWQRLEEGDRQISENETRLADGRNLLERTWDELQTARQQLADGKAQLEAGEAKLRKGRRALKQGRQQLDTARQQLIDSWNQMEDAAELVRSTLRGALGDAANSISWASRRVLNVDDPTASAREVYITTSLRFDLGNSLKSNVEKLVNSGMIPDEALIALYEELTGGGQ